MGTHANDDVCAHARDNRRDSRRAVVIGKPPGGDALDGPLALLESNYFGSQYILQSAGQMIGTGFSGRVCVIRTRILG